MTESLVRAGHVVYGGAVVREATVTDYLSLPVEDECAYFVDGPAKGKIVPVTGPYEEHLQDGIRYYVVPRGKDTWVFPIRYAMDPH